MKPPAGFSRAVLRPARRVQAPVDGSNTAVVPTIELPSVPPAEYSFPLSAAATLSMIGVGKLAMSVHGAAYGAAYGTLDGFTGEVTFGVIPAVASRCGVYVPARFCTGAPLPC